MYPALRGRQAPNYGEGDTETNHDPQTKGEADPAWDTESNRWDIDARHHCLNPVGRKTTYSDTAADAVLERLETGMPLEQICRLEDMPALRTVYRWRDANPEFAARLAQARANGFDMMAADCLRIADDASNDVIETPSGPKFNGEFAQRSKIRIETRLKLLAVWARSKYGEHATLQVENLPAGLSRAEQLAALQSGSIEVSGLLERWTKPVEAIEAESEPETPKTTQATAPDDFIDLPD